MFGMLDYRAHKLYRVLVAPVVFVLSIFNVVCLPIVAYLIAIYFASRQGLQFLLALVVLFLLGIPWYFVVRMILAVPVGIFNFLIDPEPAEGRTKEEAKMVVASGDKAILLLKLNKPVTEWTDEDIEGVAGISSIFFRGAVRQRIYAIREYYLDNPDVAKNEYATNKFLKQVRLSMGWLETAVTNPMLRSLILQLAVLLIIFTWLSLKGDAAQLTEYIFVIGLGALTVGLLGWWFNKLREENEQSEQRQAVAFGEYEKRRLSDDEVMAAQREFEKRLDENVDLPDGIRWSTAFTYWHLMRKWFSILMASNRYDEESADKIKSDWLDYMKFLEERETSFF